MKNTRGYFDIDAEYEALLVTDRSSLEEVMMVKDMQQRKIWLHDEIDIETVSGAIHNIYQYNREDADLPVEGRKPILLYIASNGGSVDAGFALIDAIQTSKTPVYTINTGYWYSMGFLIGLAGKKRFAMPNATFLMHDGSNFIWTSGSKAQDQADFNRRVEARVKQYILDHSTLTSKEYDKKQRVEWYLFADEAKEKGFIDQIIGVDCDIDTVV
nr:MAG TPA: Protease subunit of ATP-dependent Clp protease [Bacteriophage sp.]